MIRKVSVAILSWNGRHHLETCLDALAAQRDPRVDWEILVFDNGSTDGTAAWMSERWGHAGGNGRVRLLESPVNLGFCGGNNRLVAASDADAVALLNNDTRPEPGWLGALVEALASAPEDVAAVSGRIVDWAGERLDFGRGLMTFDGHAFQLDFRKRLASARVPKAGEELLFACGGNMLIRRSSFLEAGGFDESYFAYLEDVDLGWRLWSGGERILFAPEATVHHRSGATSDLLGLFNRGFLFERNAFLTACKNYEPGLWERILPAVMLTLTSRTQALLLENNPGMGTLRIDPYAGHIANTGGNGQAPAPVSAAPVIQLPPITTWKGFKIRWEGYGPRGALPPGPAQAGDRGSTPAGAAIHARSRAAVPHRRAHHRPVPRPPLAARPPGRRGGGPRRRPAPQEASGPRDLRALSPLHRPHLSRRRSSLREPGVPGLAAGGSAGRPGQTGRDHGDGLSPGKSVSVETFPAEVHRPTKGTDDGTSPQGNAAPWGHHRIKTSTASNGSRPVSIACPAETGRCCPAETSRRPRGLQRDIVDGLGRLYGHDLPVGPVLRISSRHVAPIPSRGRTPGALPGPCGSA